MFLMLIRRADGAYLGHDGFTPDRSAARLVTSDGTDCDTRVPPDCDLIPFHGDEREDSDSEVGPRGTVV